MLQDADIYTQNLVKIDFMLTSLLITERPSVTLTFFKNKNREKIWSKKSLFYVLMMFCPSRKFKMAKGEKTLIESLYGNVCDTSENNTFLPLSSSQSSGPQLKVVETGILQNFIGL